MKHSELKALIREVIEEMTDDTDNLPGDLGLAALEELGGGQVTSFKNRVMDEGNSGVMSMDTTFSIKEIPDLDIYVDVSYRIYQGSGAADDPNNITLEEVIVTTSIMDTDLERVDNHPASSREEKILVAIRTAVRILYPKTPPGVFIPEGADILVINEKLNRLLQNDIDQLENDVYEHADKNRNRGWR
jgi:hypothetical protein